MDKKFHDEYLRKLSQKDRAEMLTLAHKQYTVVPPEPVMDQGEYGEYQSMDERYDVVYRCNCCGEKIFMDNFCSKCGQRTR